MKTTKYILIEVKEEDLHILQNIPEENITHQLTMYDKDIDYIGKPFLYPGLGPKTKIKK
jgi:hypothetical protein